MDIKSLFLTILTTLIGIVASVIITKKFAKDKKPLWYFKLNVLFSAGNSKIDNLKITYKDRVTDSLSSVYFAFWNNGKETITGDDVAEPICFCVPEGYKIFSADIVRETNKSNSFQVKISQDERKAEITFKYIDYKQGAVIQLFSDCDKVESYKLQGAVMGCGNFKNEIYYRKRRNNCIFWKGICVVLIFLLLVMAVDVNQRNYLILFDLGMLSLYVIINAVLNIISFFNTLKETKYKLPKELRDYFME